jgi:hypothetical protein
MCDASNTLQSSLLFWTLHPKQPLSIYCPRHRASLFPGLWSALQRPHGEASRLDNTIATVDAILSRAKAKCIRDHLLLAESEVQFLQYVTMPLHDYTCQLHVCIGPSFGRPRLILVYWRLTTCAGPFICGTYRPFGRASRIASASCASSTPPCW